MSKKGPKAASETSPDHDDASSPIQQTRRIASHQRRDDDDSVSDGEDLEDLEAAAHPSRHLARAFFFFLRAKRRTAGGVLVVWKTYFFFGWDSDLGVAVLRGRSTG